MKPWFFLEWYNGYIICFDSFVYLCKAPFYQENIEKETIHSLLLVPTYV